jgi:hypothetical protein
MNVGAPIACPDTMECPAYSVQPVQCKNGENCDANDPITQSGSIGQPDPRDATNTAVLPWKSCPYLHYCINGKKFKCMAGYVCTVSSITATPENGRGGDLCAAGYYCGDANGFSAAPVACPVGTYGPSQGAGSLSDCITCSAGFVCS